MEVRLEESQEGGSSELDSGEILGRLWVGRRVTGKIFSIGKTVFTVEARGSGVLPQGRKRGRARAQSHYGDPSRRWLPHLVSHVC